MFLYGRNRFLNDDGFQALNGIGSLLVHCIDAFPPRYEDYEGNKAAAKERLKTPMRELKDRLQRKALLRAFLKKSLFNGGEVNYLTIKEDGVYHVYWNEDVTRIMADVFVVENSKARQAGQFDDQKVLFKYEDINAGELEMRNDGPGGHYAEVRFNMNKGPCVQLLKSAEFEECLHTSEITSYGQATRNFWKWSREGNPT